MAGALHDRAALRNPAPRAASAAMAAFQVGRDQHDARSDHDDSRAGWWRHRHGGYGWVGPLFWPFADDDFTDYTLWGTSDAAAFWDYGYNDIYAGIFSPYGYEQLSGYLPRGGTLAPDHGGGSSGSAVAGSAAPTPILQMCSDDSSEFAAVAGVPTDQLQKALQLNDAQRGMLDELAKASMQAAQDIKASCPTRIAVTAPTRLADMQERIEAMIAAVATLQPPLQKFYDALDDDQKAKLNAIGAQQRAVADPLPNGGTAINPTDHDAQSTSTDPANTSVADPRGNASASAADEWPAAVIDARLHPTAAQREADTAFAIGRQPCRSFAFAGGHALAKAPALGHQVLSAYRHLVGSFEVIALSDGAVDLPVNLFAKADPAETAKILTATGSPTDWLGTEVNAFLVNTGDRLVLIDSGAGQLFGPTLGRFAANLAALGIDPASVDVIAMTHLHPDHFGGLPGITAIVAPPGHMYRVTSGNQTLLIWGDIVHSAPLQFPHPEWAIAFDTDPNLAIATRNRVFDMTATNTLTLAGAHLPFPGIGHVVKSGTGYAYLPLFWAPG